MPAMPRTLRRLVLVSMSLGLAACVSSQGRVADKAAPPTAAASEAVAAPLVTVGTTVFTSGPINLVRFADQLQAAGSSHNVQRLQIPAGSAGVVLSSGENWVAVRFNRSGYLYFTLIENSLDGSRIRDPRMVGKAYLYLPDWDGRSGQVMLNGQRWLAVDGSREVYLQPNTVQTSRSDSLSSRWMDQRR